MAYDTLTELNNLYWSRATMCFISARLQQVCHKTTELGFPEISAFFLMATYRSKLASVLDLLKRSSSGDNMWGRRCVPDADTRIQLIIRLNSQ